MMEQDYMNDFESMLEDSMKKLVKIRVGDKVKAKIINITKENVIVDLGGAVDGIIEKSELLNENGELEYTIGDEIEAYAVRYNESGITLSTALNESERIKSTLEKAYNHNIPIEGKVVAVNKGGFEVRVLNKQRAFCPISQIDNKFVEKPELYLNNTYKFKITQFENKDSKNFNIVLSRRVILDEELKKKKEETLSKLEVGKIMLGKVSRLADFGAFVDLGGIDGLVHISEISWDKIGKPEEKLKVNDNVNVKVIGIEKKSDDDIKISLSIKQTMVNPIEATFDSLQVGNIINGTVKRIAPFGAFVEIAPGIEGMLHISELSLYKRVNHPSEIVKENDKVEVMIIDINKEEKKIALSMKRLQKDPWEDITTKYTLDQIVSTTVEKVADFGVFAKIEEGIIGLLPLSKIRKNEDIKIKELKPGDNLNLKIIAIDTEKKKITLAPLDITEIAKIEIKSIGDSPEDDWRAYASTRKEEVSPFKDLLNQ